MKTYNIKNLPVADKMCETCPFRPDGVQEVREKVEARCMEVSQMCHGRGWPKSTHLCRGARNFQLRVFHALGVIEAATDAAWDKLRKKLNC